MAAVAQALQVPRRREECPVAPVGRDVVHIRGPDTQTALGTLAAERFPQELRRPECLGPGRQTVPVVPRGAFSALGRLGPMVITPAIAGQIVATRFAAWPQGFLCHGLSPPGKTKTPRPMTHQQVHSLAPAFNALAFLNIQN